MIFTVVCLAIALRLGGTTALFITIMLAILEVSLSFDNAIINAKELEKMSDIWKRRFLTRGMLIAVFGMRIFFPLIIVSVVGDVSMWQAAHIALYNPAHYQHLIEASHISLAAFGGVFLLMVFLAFFLDETKDIHWMRVIESRLASIGKLESIEVVLALLALWGVTKLPMFPIAETGTFLIAGIM